MFTRRLSDLKKGNRGKVVRVTGQGKITRRLMDMGLVAGSEVEVKRVAPLGDPIEIRIKDYNLTLRKQEAAGITVEGS